jgi:hypothetical protein
MRSKCLPSASLDRMPNRLAERKQGAEPDRLQLRSPRSFLASVSALPAAGELGRYIAARGLV